MTLKIIVIMEITPDSDVTKSARKNYRGGSGSDVFKKRDRFRSWILHYHMELF